MSYVGPSPKSSTDLFLSYHRPDSESVQRVRRVLESQGISTFFDRESLPAGMPWVEGLERALRGVQAVAVFIGPELGVWQKSEIAFALDHQAQEKGRGGSFPVIPILLPGAEDLSSGFLALNTWVDLRHDLTATDAIAQLVKAVRGETVAVPVDSTPAICPYQGLNGFREEHAAFFCGRRILSERLLEMVASGRDLVAVIGASGSGKSSVVHSGLLPLMRLQRPPARTWAAVSFKPGNRPFHRLAAAMLPLLDPAGTEVDRMVGAGKLGDHLAGRDGEIEAAAEQIIARSKGIDRLLIIVDQFEELFTQTSEEERGRFIRAMTGAFGRGPLQFVLTLRADYYGHLIGISPDLSDRVEHGLLNVAGMSRPELEATIVEPAMKLGVTLEPGLTDRILSDLGREPGQLPLLQFALTELWMRSRGRRMTHAAYDEFGGVTQAISHRADAELKRFDSDQQEIIRKVFSRLVHVTSPDEGGDDTRQRASLAALDAAARPFIDVLTNARLLVTARDDVNGDETVEVAHEALIFGWNTLRSWLNQDREFLLWRQRLRSSSTQWEHTRRDRGALLHGALLTEAENWKALRAADLSDSERQFIASSGALANEERLTKERARRNRTLALAGGLAVALLLAGVAVLQWRRAVNEREIALAKSLISQARLISDTEPSKFDKAVLLAIESEKIQPSAEADAILREAILLLPKEISRFQLKCDVMNAAFAPSGRFLACVDTSRASVKIVSTADGTDQKDVFVLPVENFSEISVLAPSPDGQFLIAGFRQAGSRLLDMKTGKLLTSPGAGLRTTAAAFAASGRTAAAAFFDASTGLGTLQLLSIPDGAAIEYPFPRLPRVQSLTFSADGRFLAASHEGHTRTSMDITIFDLTDKKSNRTISGGTATANLALSAGAIAFSRDNTVNLVRLDSEADVAGRLVHSDFIRAVDLSSDGQYVVSGSDDGTAQVMETRSGVLAGRIPAGSPVQAAAFTADNNLVLLSKDGSVRTVDFVRRPELRNTPSVSGQIVGISPIGQYFTTLSRTGGDSDSKFELAVSDRLTGMKLWAKLVPRDVTYGLNRFGYSDDEKYFTIISRDHGVGVYDAKTGHELFHKTGGSDLQAHSMSGDGKIVALANPKAIEIMQTPSGVLQSALDVPNARLLQLSFDGSLLAVAREDRVVSVVDTQTKKELSTVRQDAPVTLAAFSIDRQYLLTSSDDRTLTLSFVQTGKQAWRLPNLDVSQLVFAHDGRVISVIDQGRVFRFIDTATGATVAFIRHPEERPPVAAAFARDGSYVEIADEMSVRRHFLSPGKLIEQACSVLTLNIPMAEWSAVAAGMPYRAACPNLPRP